MDNQTLYTEQFRGKYSTYFMDLKTSEKVGYYLVLTQSKKNKEGAYQSSKLRVFSDEIETFSQAFDRLVEAYHDNRKVEEPLEKGPDSKSQSNPT